MAGKYLKTKFALKSGANITVYASPRIHEALSEVTGPWILYKGVRLAQVIEAVYVQGRKDGARAAFDALQKGVTQAQKQVPHRNPGRPKGS